MALVAYGSDISDSEQEDDEQDQPLPTLKPAATKQEPDKCICPTLVFTIYCGQYRNYYIVYCSSSFIYAITYAETV